jgi:inner membrane protein
MESETGTKSGLKMQMSTSMSITLKAVIIAILTLVMLIPSFMIQELIQERQSRSAETIQKIHDKWSNPQTLCGPLLVIPYTEAFVNSDNKETVVQHEMFVTPENLSFDAHLFPEERYYGIFKTVVYKSEMSIKGKLSCDILRFPKNNAIQWEKASVRIGIADLRGLNGNISVVCNGRNYTLEPAYVSPEISALAFGINEIEALQSGESLDFEFRFSLNGSSSLDFIPVGRTTDVHLAGEWESPSYTGQFSPEILPSKAGGFEARWSILSFNRNIPEVWTDSYLPTDLYLMPVFGVHLLETVDHYQKDMRSAKYAVLFIILTFAIFFFVEVLTRRRIHPIQYLLVGLALLVFYTLLLSLSERLYFALAYLIASVATIGMITVYSHSIFKSRRQTLILGLTLAALYIFLYTVLQIEDAALLIGSIGLFVILGIFMYVSRKINWYKHSE